MGYSDEELQRFVEENREAIERLMASRASSDAGGSSGPGRKGEAWFEEDFDRFRNRAEEDRERMEDAFRGVYEAFADPEVQKHFMTMGLNFVMGMSALLQRMPAPGFVKETASGMEASWKKSACGANADCGVKKKKIEITDDAPSQIRFDEEERYHGPGFREGRGRVRPFRSGVRGDGRSRRKPAVRKGIL